MVDQTSQMFITGPDVIKTVTGEEVTMEELGGAHTHMAKSGTAHYAASGEQDAFDYVRELLSYLPPNNSTDAPRYQAAAPTGPIEENLTDEDLELDTLIPDSPNQPYDMHEVITRLLDDDEFLESQGGQSGEVEPGPGCRSGCVCVRGSGLFDHPRPAGEVADLAFHHWPISSVILLPAPIGLARLGMLQRGFLRMNADHPPPTGLRAIRPQRTRLTQHTKARHSVTQTSPDAHGVISRAGDGAGPDQP